MEPPPARLEAAETSARPDLQGTSNHGQAVKATEPPRVNARHNKPARMVGHSHEVALEFVKADSEETSGDSGFGANAVDNDPDTFWHTQ